MKFIKYKQMEAQLIGHLLTIILPVCKLIYLQK